MHTHKRETMCVCELEKIQPKKTRRFISVGREELNVFLKEKPVGSVVFRLSQRRPSERCTTPSERNFLFFQHSVRHEEFVPFRRGKFGPADADFCSSATPVDDGVANQRPADDAGEDETAVRQQPQVQPLLEQRPAQSDPQFRILRLGFVAHVPVSHRTPLQRRISRSRRNRFPTALQFPQLGTKGNCTLVVQRPFHRFIH